MQKIIPNVIDKIRIKNPKTNEEREYSVKNDSLYDPKKIMYWYCESRLPIAERGEIGQIISKRHGNISEEAVQNFFERGLLAQRMETYPVCLGHIATVYFGYRTVIALFNCLYGESLWKVNDEMKNFLLFTLLNYLCIKIIQKMI